jgi:phage I-like protein
LNGVKLKKVLSLNYKEGEKVKVSPHGDVVGLDGRMFKIDAQMLVDNILKNDIHIPLDENHYFGAAVGWFDKSSFEVREDGLYASLELNQKGNELVESKAYRYMSPVFIMNADNRVAELDSVGLVNRPNLLNKELNEKTNKEKKLEELEEFKKQINDLKNEVKALKEAKPTVVSEDIKKVEENLKSEVEVLTTAIKEMNSKMQVVFKKVELEENDKKVTLSENDKKVADLLGISHEEFLKSKEENK